MSTRKKQPRRGARKPNPSKPKADTSKVKGQPLTPFMISGQLIGAVKDENGEVIHLQPMGQIEIMRPNFKRVDEVVAEMVAQAQELEQIQRDAMAGSRGRP